MSQIKQNSDASVGIQGTDGDDGPFIFVTIPWGTALPLTQSSAVCARRMVVKYIYLNNDVVATNAVTATIFKVPSGTAPASGTALHTGTLNLQATANTPVAGTLSAVAGAIDIAAGSRIAAVVSGAIGAAGSGSFTVALCPA